MTRTLMIAAAGLAIAASTGAQAGDTFKYLDGTALSPNEFVIHSNPGQFTDRAKLNSAIQSSRGAVPQPAPVAPRASTNSQHWMRPVDLNATGGGR